MTKRTGHDEKQKTAIDDVGQSADLSALNCQNEWRSGSTGRLLGDGDQLGVVGTDDQSHDEHGADVEDQDTPERALDGSRNGLARVLRLAEGDADCEGVSLCQWHRPQHDQANATDNSIPIYANNCQQGSQHAERSG